MQTNHPPLFNQVPLTISHTFILKVVYHFAVCFHMLANMHTVANSSVEFNPNLRL